ncbi:ANK-REP-REGION domain-containing protein [Mycena chlorophos]|uniref:ANK-REP-REGION domain-containing protein n=1 Tax=Mycena chlorophos TaxID=658473 RepID=A0A8H6SRD3_MYCCL|nr:ANK-REP-REGION domain-containing protein [Mycena chlorophos]
MSAPTAVPPNPTSADVVTPALLHSCVDSFPAYHDLITAHPHALAYGLGHTGDVLGWAVIRGDCEFIRRMLHEPGWDIDPNTCEAFHRPVIEYAAAHAKEDVLRCLLVECADIVHPVRLRGTNAVRAAIGQRKNENLKLLLEYATEGRNDRLVVNGWPLRKGLQGWEMEELESKGWDVPNLHFAVREGNMHAVKTLLQAGADASVEDLKGQTVDVSEILRELRLEGNQSHNWSADIINRGRLLFRNKFKMSSGGRLFS